MICEPFAAFQVRSWGRGVEVQGLGFELRA